MIGCAAEGPLVGAQVGELVDVVLVFDDVCVVEVELDEVVDTAVLDVETFELNVEDGLGVTETPLIEV